MPNCKSFLVIDVERSMLGDARDFNNMEMRAVIKLLFLQGKLILLDSINLLSPIWIRVQIKTLLLM